MIQNKYFNKKLSGGTEFWCGMYYESEECMKKNNTGSEFTKQVNEFGNIVTEKLNNYIPELFSKINDAIKLTVNENNEEIIRDGIEYCDISDNKKEAQYIEQYQYIKLPAYICKGEVELIIRVNINPCLMKGDRTKIYCNIAWPKTINTEDFKSVLPILKGIADTVLSIVPKYYVKAYKEYEGYKKIITSLDDAHRFYSIGLGDDSKEMNNFVEEVIHSSKAYKENSLGATLLDCFNASHDIFFNGTPKKDEYNWSQLSISPKLKILSALNQKYYDKKTITAVAGTAQTNSTTFLIAFSNGSPNTVLLHYNLRSITIN
jgi:hypothetical protein